MEINILGHPAYVSRLKRFFEVVGATDDSLLLSGPPGCGKEIWLEYVIAHSKRNQKPVIKVNCAELGESDAQREIFADTAEGLLNQAREGTLILDELQHLPLAVQAAIGKFIESRAVIDRRTRESRSIDTRILATAGTKENLAPTLEFRFTYRISLIPLARRKEDIPYLIKGLLNDSPIRCIRYIALLKVFYNQWQGNVRELKNYLAQTTAYYQSSRSVSREQIAGAGLFGEISTRYFQDILSEETWYFDYYFEEDFRNFFAQILNKTAFRQEIIDEGLVVPLCKQDESFLVLNLREDDFEEKALRVYRKFAEYIENLKSGKPGGRETGTTS
ncbi:MAG: sigma 54-interacting transcriptional regulator [Pseudomonadota bacterium]